MSSHRISALEMAKEAFAILLREKEVVFLLAALLAILGIIFFWPVREPYLRLLDLTSPIGATNPEAEALGKEILDYMKIWVWPYFLLTYGGLMIFSRIAIGGREVAFMGGFGPTVIRALFTFWRLICAIGWALVFIFGIAVILVLLSIGLGGGLFIMGGGEGEATALVAVLFIPLYAAAIYGSFVLTVLMGVSFHGEARDRSLPIHQSYKFMKGNLGRAAGVLMLVGMAFGIVSILLWLFFAASFLGGSTILVGIGFFLMFTLNLIYQLYWIAYAALYANRLVPEFAEFLEDED